MFEPRIIHVHRLEESYDFPPSLEEAWFASLCCPTAGHWLVSWSKAEVAMISPDGDCDCDDRILDEDDQPRQFRFTLHGNGDSGERWVCFGRYHHHFVCDEMGMGWYSEGQPSPCDGSCRAPVDSLPAPVAKAVQAFLDSAGRDS